MTNQIATTPNKHTNSQRLLFGRISMIFTCSEALLLCLFGPTKYDYQGRVIFVTVFNVLVLILVFISWWAIRRPRSITAPVRESFVRLGIIIWSIVLILALTACFSLLRPHL